MATTTKKIIGKVPMPRGDYASGTTYYRHNIVTHLGSAFICTAETTTSAPAALGADGMTVTVNEGWAVFADGRAIYAEGARLSAVETSASANRADIDRLAWLQNAPDDRALPLLCGQPPILFGADTPKESVVPDNWRQYDPATGEGYNWNGRPSAVGQQYIDTTAQSGGRYVAARDGEWDLKWINS